VENIKAILPPVATMALESLLGLVASDTTLSLHKYRPLSNSEDFRLLVIEPGNFDDAVSCNLIHVAFDKKPIYQALSYTWGANIKTHAVKILNNVLPVTANLYYVLKRFDIRINDGSSGLMPSALIRRMCKNEISKLGLCGISILRQNLLLSG